jgi:hypothetical protein
MDIMRQYQSSNCTLILQGLNNDATNSFNLDILLSAECYIISSQKTLRGGKTFLENLTKVVSAYAQDLLSGLPHPPNLNLESDLINLQPYNHVHRLTWQKSKDDEQDVEQIDLTTVELFDLLETLDQFSADSSTLPDLKWHLEPLSRRHRQDGEPIFERSIPAVVGIGTVALTAIASFMVQPPVVREPKSQPLEGTTEIIPQSQDIPNPTTTP